MTGVLLSVMQVPIYKIHNLFTLYYLIPQYTLKIKALTIDMLYFVHGSNYEGEFSKYWVRKIGLA